MTTNASMTIQGKAEGTQRVFPLPDTNLGKILSGNEYRQKFHANLKTWNPVIAFLYRIGLLPLLGMSKTVMLLITKGCKSGKTRYTPIGYFSISGEKYLFSAWGRRTGWYRNMTANPEAVAIQIGLKKHSIKPLEITNPEVVRQTLEQLISESPEVAKYLFGWDPQTDQVVRSDFSPIIERVLIIKLLPQ